MKLIFILIFFISIINANFISLSEEEKVYLTNKKIVTMCVDPEWEPFEKINEEGLHEGIAADLINLISKRLNINIILIKTKDWDESLEFSKKNKCDILSFLNDTPKRREWLTFTNTLFSDPNVLVGRIERNYIEDISKEKLSIVLPRNTAMAEKFSNDFPNLTIISTKSEAEVFNLVEKRVADITLRSLIVAAYTIKKEGLFNLKIVGEVKGYENLLKIGVRKDEPLLREILNKGIRTLTKKDIDQIVNTHVNIIIKKTTTFTIAIWIFFILLFILLVVLLLNYFLKREINLEVKKYKSQQKELLEQKRKAEIAELLGNISHQWKNGLTQISSLNLEMILMYELNHKIDKNDFYLKLKDTEKSIKFMDNTMNTFLNYYKENFDCSVFFIKNNIQDVIQLIDIKIKNSKVNIIIKENFSTQVSANKNEWMHIWLNLINNSIKAASLNNISNPIINIIIDKDYIVFEDDCNGIDDEILQMILDNKQKGLGLKMSKNILEKSAWEMNIKNINNGVRFLISKKLI